MEDQNIKPEESLLDENFWQKAEKSHRRGKVMGGLLIVTIGSLFLARELGAEIPFWVFTWKMLLIGFGLVLAVKHKFLHPGWIILVAIGGAFLLTDIYPGMQIKPILWPSLIILFGLIIIFKPRRKHFGQHRKHWRKFHHSRHHSGYYNQCEDFYNHERPSSEDYIDSTAIMSGVRRKILSKNFKGGDVTNIFGGSEIDLSQADFEEKATLEITLVFGGAKLLVPSNWEIRSEIVTIMGNVEDKRVTQPDLDNGPAKVLILTGTIVFGGIDIKSF